MTNFEKIKNMSVSELASEFCQQSYEKYKLLSNFVEMYELR